MPLIARQRSRLAVLAVVALVGSLLAVSAVPAVAAGDKKASNEAIYSACVDAAIGDAGFTDMDGHAFEAEANCLAHYNITKGTSEGVYSPSASVTRLQMALFLARAAGPAGIELLEPAEDQGFTDIDGLSTEIQDAINQIAEVGIIKGTSDTAFSPDGMVSRADMAVFLDAFVKEAPIGPGGLGGEISDHDDIGPLDDAFDDVGGVSFGAYGAIRRVYELGIAKGTSESMFSPNALVTRGQMAAFITRALDHTNARPAGVSIQSDKMETDNSNDGEFVLQISVRDDMHAPVVDAVVDHFSASSADAAFDDDGLCKDLGNIVDPAEGSVRCEIDAGDEATDSDGNLEFDVSETTGYCPGNTKWIWAWTGDIGDKFDADDTDAAMVGVGITKAKKSIKASHDADASTVEFGTTVTVTLQLVDNADPKKGDPVAEKDVEMMITETATGGVTETRTRTLKTDESGKIELTYSFDDPDADADDEEVMLAISRAGVTGLDFDDQDPPQTPATVDVATITWSDDDPVATSLSLSQSVSYHLASDAGGGVRHTVTATLTDQYGDPVPGVVVNFWSNANNSNATGPNDSDGNPTIQESDRTDDGLGGAKADPSSTGSPGSARTCGTEDTDDATMCANVGSFTGDDSFGGSDKTNRSGVARKSYNRDADTSFTEIINALAVIGKRDGALTEDEDDDAATPNTANLENDDIHGDADAVTEGNQALKHYWAIEAGDAALAASPARAVDTDANTVVVAVGGAADDDAGTNRLAKYDSNDQFNAGETGDTGGVKMDVFEDNLKVGNEIIVDMASDPEPGVNRFTNNALGVPDAVDCHD